MGILAYLRKVLAEEVTGEQRDEALSLPIPLGSTTLGVGNMAEAGVRVGPAANTEVALTNLYTDCDTALVDNITGLPQIRVARKAIPDQDSRARGLLLTVN